MKINSNYNGENVDIVASNISNEFANIVYVTSAGDLKVSRKFIGIDDEVEIGTNSQDLDTNASYPSNGTSTYSEIEDAFKDSIVALWDFDEDIGESRVSKIGFPYALKDGGSTQVPRVSGGPLSNYAASFDNNKFLRLETSLIGDLNISKFGDEVTVISLSKHVNFAGAQFLAGVWQENNSDPRRQYGLFSSLSVYGGAEQVCGHVSYNGGPSPKVLTSGFLPYSRDYASNITKLQTNSWVYQAMSYDGQEIRVYVDGKFEPRSTYTEPGAPNGEGITYSKNPYIFTSGLNDVTKPGAFSVGGCRLSSMWTNNMQGDIAMIAVFKKKLSQEEIVKFQRLCQGLERPGVSYAYYHNSYLAGERGVNNIGWSTYFGNTALSGNNAYNWYLASPSAGIYYLERKAYGFQSICYDDQNFGIPLSTVRKLTVDTNNANTVDKINFAIKVGQDWYISTTSFTQNVSAISSTDWSNSETKTLSAVQTELWRPVTIVYGSTFTVGTGITLPEDSIVNAIGIYTPSSTNFIRVKNLSIW